MSTVVLPPSRKPKPGEKCPCGRPAVKVWLLRSGISPTCGQSQKPVKR